MIYNVVLNSDLRISGTTVSEAIYAFDWSVFTDSKYKVSSKFISSKCDITAFLTIPMLQVNLGQSSIFTTKINQTTASSTMCIGTLQPNITNSNSCFLFGDYSINPPFFLNQKPTENNFFIKIMTNDVTPVPWTDYTNNSLIDYILILTFETI